MTPILIELHCGISTRNCYRWSVVLTSQLSHIEWMLLKREQKYRLLITLSCLPIILIKRSFVLKPRNCHHPFFVRYDKRFDEHISVVRLLSSDTFLSCLKFCQRTYIYYHFNVILMVHFYYYANHIDRPDRQTDERTDTDRGL